MPHLKEIQIFPIARSGIDSDEVREWLASVGASGYEFPKTPDAVVGLAAKRCYMSFEPGLNPNVTKVRKDWHKYLTNILKSGHGSVCEHATYSFAIEGITRVCTAELNRHRAGAAISEGSMRYIRFDDIGFWMPLLFRGEDQRSVETRKEFFEAFKEDEERYKRLCALWEIENGGFARKKKLTSAFRRIVGMGVSSGGVWTWNFRALRHIIALRSTPHAEEEIALLASMLGKYMVEMEPRLFGDFKQVDGFWVPEYAKV